MIEAILTFLLVLLIIVIVILPNLAEKSKQLRIILYLSLAGLGGLFMSFGILSLLSSIVYDDPNPGMNMTIMGPGMFITGIFVTIIPFRYTRKIFAKFIPINPDSAVHTGGIVFAFIMIGMSLTMMFSMDPAAFFSDSSMQVTEVDLIAQSLFLTLIAFVGVGIFIRRTPGECIKRLGLTMPTPKYILIGIAATVVFLAFTISYEFIINYFFREALSNADEAMNAMFKNPTILIILAVSLGAGISEEILFRGAIQPKFGLIFTAFLFAVIHFHYFTMFAIFELFIVGILLGILRIKTNTTTCIITHSGYNLAVFALILFSF